MDFATCACGDYVTESSAELSRRLNYDGKLRCPICARILAANAHRIKGGAPVQTPPTVERPARRTIHVDLARVTELARAGVTLREAAERFGVPYTTFRRYAGGANVTRCNTRSDIRRAWLQGRIERNEMLKNIVNESRGVIQHQRINEYGEADY